MRSRILPFVSIASLLAFAGSAQADGSNHEPYFTPLTSSAVVTDVNSDEELTQPWNMPAGISQEGLTSLQKIEAEPNTQSTIRVAELGRGASMWDMVAFDDSGRYVFIPHETFTGAGVTRYDIANDRAEVLFAGDLKGPGSDDAESDWSNDWGAFDPSTFTPNQTLLLGEEWSGEGRIMEVLNPFAPADQIQIRELESIANVSHEGLRFSKDGRTLYYVDEWNSGSIYKFVSSRTDRRNGQWDYTQGQTFVLKVLAFDGDVTKNWNDEANEGKTRTGEARWVPLTYRRGGVRPGITNPFRNGPTNNPNENTDTRGGRPAADDAGGTPYGRPEDMEVGTLANGNEVVYFAATSEKTVYSIEMTGNGRAMVRVTASEAATPKNVGFEATTGVLNSPDNLAQDGFGNIYIIEDAPNRSDVGGDIWFIRDTDRDGVAESLDHFLSLRVRGSESTGMIFNPNKPTEFVVAVQHPSSTAEEGNGDALWRFDISNLVEPPCANGERISDYDAQGLTNCEEVDEYLESMQETPWERFLRDLANNPIYRDLLRLLGLLP